MYLHYSFLCKVDVANLHIRVSYQAYLLMACSRKILSKAPVLHNRKNLYAHKKRHYLRVQRGLFNRPLQISFNRSTPNHLHNLFRSVVAIT
jgi:hypothetical protein